MLLKAITLKNFKGIREPIRIEAKPVTLLFGPNSAGKSTIVQALHYAHEILERENVDPDRTLQGGEAVELGGFNSLVHGHDLNREISLKFELDLESIELPGYRLSYVTGSSDMEKLFDIEHRIKTADLELVIGWSQLLEKPLLKECNVAINGEPLGALICSEDGRRVELNGFYTNHPIFWPEGETENEEEGTIPLGDLEFAVMDLIRDQYFYEGAWLNIELDEQRTPLPRWGLPLRFSEFVWHEKADQRDIREFTERVSSLIVGPFELLRKALKSFLYLGPLRDVPPRNFSPMRSPVESRWAQGLAAWDLLAQEGSPLVSKVNNWLENDTQFGSGYRLSAKKYKSIDMEGPLYLALSQGRYTDSELFDGDLVSEYLNQTPERRELSVVDINTGVSLEPQDLGVGLSQLVPVVVAAVHAKSGVVAMEQPELHIHPAWQVVLGDLFASQIKERPVMFLIETHSEHLVLRMLRRIRETTANELPPGAPSLRPEDVAIYYVEHEKDTTKLTQLRVDQTGEFIDRWPRGFFEERAGELF